MRLTTYNIRSKYLMAGCCASEYMERYWQYMEEGDKRNAECAFNKAAKLDALRATLLRWHPTIQNAKVRTIKSVVSSGSITFPYSISEITVNGINIMDPIYIHSGNNEEVFRAVSSSINGKISNSDDVLQCTMEVSTSPLTALFTFIYDEDMSPLSFGLTSFGTGVTATTTYSQEADYEFDTPCITDEEMLSIVGKIDELCGCGC